MSEQDTFSFRVGGSEYRPHSTMAKRYDEEFAIHADDVGDALNKLVNRSDMWETLDHERPFSIRFTGRKEGTPQ